jgi:hypothetical protein
MRILFALLMGFPLLGWADPKLNSCFELSIERRFGTLKPIREPKNPLDYWGDRFWVDQKLGLLLEWTGTEVIERSFAVNRSGTPQVPQLKKYEAKSLQLAPRKHLLMSQDPDTLE